MNALDVYTKINIKDYLANPEESKDKIIQKKDKKLGNIFAKMILPQNVMEELLIGVIFYEWPIVFN